MAHITSNYITLFVCCCFLLGENIMATWMFACYGLGRGIKHDVRLQWLSCCATKQGIYPVRIKKTCSLLIIGIDYLFLYSPGPPSPWDGHQWNDTVAVATEHLPPTTHLPPPSLNCFCFASHIREKKKKKQRERDRKQVKRCRSCLSRAMEEN